MSPTDPAEIERVLEWLDASYSLEAEQGWAAQARERHGIK